MSPKRRVLVLSGIFAAFGVGVSMGIIAANGGFTTGSSILNPPSGKDIFVVGSNINNGTVLQYKADVKGPSSALVSSLVTLAFEKTGDKWNVTFTIKNGTSPEVTHTMTMSKQLTREGAMPDWFTPYFEPIQSSILAVRDMEYGDSPKYLVVGAPWNTIFVGSSSTTVRVTSHETVETAAGPFDSFVLSYKLHDQTSRVWMVGNLPLPAKAETFDEKDEPYYSFELVNVSGISTPTQPL